MPRSRKPPHITAVATGKNLPKLVEAYACGQCTEIYALSTDAANCCACRTCGTKFEKAKIFNTCAHCRYGASLRSARADVRRAREDLLRSEEKLKRLLTAGRPPKGTAR